MARIEVVKEGLVLTVRNDLGDFMVIVSVHDEAYERTYDYQLSLTPLEWWEIVEFVGITSGQEALEVESNR